MMRTVFQTITLTVLIAALPLTASALQTSGPALQHARLAAQQPQRDLPKAPKQAQQLPRNLTADRPNAPKKSEQQQKNRTANAVVDRYLGGFQKNVGLDDEQTRKFSSRLGGYVRQQLLLADRRNQAMNRLRELNDQKASEEEIQAQYRILDETEAQQINAKRRFYSDINPALSVQQQAKLKVYMDSTEQDVRQAIQKSRTESNQ